MLQTWTELVSESPSKPSVSSAGSELTLDLSRLIDTQGKDIRSLRNHNVPGCMSVLSHVSV